VAKNLVDAKTNEKLKEALDKMKATVETAEIGG
jgi:hypothetical protein